MKVQPYLFFDGRCEEALEFYRSALGAKVGMVMRFKDNPEPPQPGGPGSAPGNDNKIMHAEFTLGESLLMASDGYATGKPEFKGFCQSISTRDDAETQRIFDALAKGGSVRMPLGKTFFASSFGMVEDRFGMPWMVITQHD
ncbi:MULTISPECIES: VOC family protein [unclassified Variovorax]|uniref:VOC family protein n=1 Tax=unclassified Variovorax TaxID=663243 RepID=UPI001BD4D86D|nr:MULTISPECIES: VOC family protein [unclassified Variovorax]